MIRYSAAAASAGFLPPVVVNTAGYIVLVSALLAVAFAVYRFSPKRKNI